MSNTDRIREVAEAYFFGIDSVDREIIASCFHADARVTLHAGTSLEQVVRGQDAIADRIFQGCSRFDASNHAISNMQVNISGNRALLSIFAVAHVLVGGTMQIRGLRYDDQLEIDAGHWRIADRVHTPRWQYDVEARLPLLRGISLGDGDGDGDGDGKAG